MFVKIAEIIKTAEEEIEELLLTSNRKITLEITERVKMIRKKSRESVSTLMESMDRLQLLEAASFYAASYHYEKRHGQVSGEMVEYYKNRYSDQKILDKEHRAHEKKLELRLRQMLMSANIYAESAKQARRKGAAVRHAENLAMRDDIFKWLDVNMVPGMSMDAAAEKMAGKVVPLSFRTVRDHVTTWKKLRSASKA